MPRTPSGLLPVNDDLLLRLHAEIARTGVHPDRLLLSAKSTPSALTPHTVDRWFADDVPQLVKSSHLDFLFATYASLPTRKNARVRAKYSVDGKSKRQPITDRYRAQVNAEITRTGLTPARLLKRSADVPAGLTSTVISRWLTARTGVATPREMDWVLSAYASLPDGAQVTCKRPIATAGDRVTITDDHRAEIQIHKRRTGLTYRDMVTLLKDTSLTANLIASWVSGTTDAADGATLNRLLKSLRGFEDTKG